MNVYRICAIASAIMQFCTMADIRHTVYMVKCSTLTQRRDLLVYFWGTYRLKDFTLAFDAICNGRTNIM